MKTVPMYLVVTLLVLCPTAAMAITAEDIVQQLEQREQSIKNIKGKFNVWAQIRTNDGNTIEIEKEYNWVKKENFEKVTIEFKSVPERFKQPYKGCPACPNTTARIATQKEIRTFNGDVTKRFFSDSNSGGIYSGSNLFFAGKVPADWLLMKKQQQSFWIYLKKDNTSLKYIGSVDLEKQKCFLLEFSSPQKNGKLYIADENGLVPVRYDVNLPNRTLPFNTRGEELYKDFKWYGNIMMPSTVIVSVYNVYPDKEELAIKEIFTVEQMEINTEIQDDEVLWQFPTGARVHDSITNKDYIINLNK